MDLKKVRSSLKKYYYPINQEKTLDTFPLKKIVFLIPSNNTEISLRPVYGAEKFRLLYQNIYRGRFLVEMQRNEILYENLLELIHRIEFYHIDRPNKPLMINELVSFIKENVISN